MAAKNKWTLLNIQQNHFGKLRFPRGFALDVELVLCGRSPHKDLW
jgi:hypothetical protein